MYSRSASQTTRASRLRRYKFHLLGAAAIAVVGTVVLGGKDASVTTYEPRLVQTITLDGYYHDNSRLTGTVHARTESELGFRVNGKIIQKLVDEGQNVKKGQALMHIDPTDLKLAYDAAKAQNVRALKDEKRIRDLLKEHAVSLQEYEHAKADADTTTAQLDIANNAFGYAELKADADGVVMSVPADAGQVVAAGQMVIRLAHNGTREAVVSLPESSLELAKTASSAFLYSKPDQAIQVKLRELSGVADPLTRTYQARYTLLGDGQNVPLGATVTVNFDSKQEGNESGYEVPIGALYDGGSGSSVWVVSSDSSTVHTVPVRVLKLGEETASITGELKSGERVVSLGAHLLKADEKVRVASSEGQQP